MDSFIYVLLLPHTCELRMVFRLLIIVLAVFGGIYIKVYIYIYKNLCGCYLVRFPCSPTSTNYIYTNDRGEPAVSYV